MKQAILCTLSYEIKTKYKLKENNELSTSAVAASFPEHESPPFPSIRYKLSLGLSHRSTDWRMVLLIKHICCFYAVTIHTNRGI